MAGGVPILRRIGSKRKGPLPAPAIASNESSRRRRREGQRCSLAPVFPKASRSRTLSFDSPGVPRSNHSSKSSVNDFFDRRDLYQPRTGEHVDDFSRREVAGMGRVASSFDREVPFGGYRVGVGRVVARDDDPAVSHQFRPAARRTRRGRERGGSRNARWMRRRRREGTRRTASLARIGLDRRTIRNVCEHVRPSLARDPRRRRADWR